MNSRVINTSLSLLLVFLLIALNLSIMPSLFIGGHDTFQYIEWAWELFNLEDPNLTFYRPLLSLFSSIL